MKRSFENISAGLNESVSINAASPEDSMLKGDVDSSLATASFTNNCLVDAQSLIELFRCVDTILVSLRSKRISPQFSEYVIDSNILKTLLITILALILTLGFLCVYFGWTIELKLQLKAYVSSYLTW
jgi:hypothetical protein